MDEKNNKNNLEVTEAAEENVNKADEQAEQENKENFFKRLGARFKSFSKRTRRQASITFRQRNPVVFPKKTSR